MNALVRPVLGLLFALTASMAGANVPLDYLKLLEAEARASAPGFSGFSAPRGAAWFAAQHGTNWTCATCQPSNPLGSGKHATTGRTIAPLAPAASPQRLTDVTKIEKWFKRNCGDVLGRACSPLEKGDFLAYVTSIKPYSPFVNLRDSASSVHE